MVQEILRTLLSVIVPLGIPVAAGVLLARYQRLDTKPLLTLYLYFLSPAIVLDTLAGAEISAEDIAGTIAFSLINLGCLWFLSVLLSRMLKLAAPAAAGLTLVSTLTNSVNYGLPLVLLAFGELGLAKASVYVITQMVIVNTVGVYLAARSEFSIRDAAKSVFRLPAIYAALLAIILRVSGAHLPEQIAVGVSMAAAAYSPVVLVILGAQMVKVLISKSDRADNGAVWTGLAVRLLISPAVAYLVLTVLHIRGTLFPVLLILASMPVAVNAVVLAERFNASPGIVSRCILGSTLASFALLPLLIAFLR